MSKFKLVSPFRPKGDQPQAIKELVEGLKKEWEHQVLLGVTGSGKTYTIAKVIEETQLPTLLISHNKTLAGQLYQELKEFFPNQPVSYFVSYYDFYQPEAYLSASDTYIAKEVDINPLIDRLRLEATSNIFTYPRSIVVASVSCIYNIGKPETYKESTMFLKVGEKIDGFDCQEKLLSLHYDKQMTDFAPGTFRVRGERIDVFLAYCEDRIVRLYFEGKKLTKIEVKGFGKKQTKQVDSYAIYPAKHYLGEFAGQKKIFAQIREELEKQIKFFKDQGKIIEALRIKKRVNYDIRMIKEAGYVNGIENYSRYFDGRKPGQAPYSLLDYFRYKYEQSFLVVIDESHVTVPQIKGMYFGDLGRKRNLIDFGFRLPSCLDNRPFRFTEFLQRVPKTIYVSATPAEYEIRKSQGRIVEQIIRPTGLIDPEVKIYPAEEQISNLITQIKRKKEKGQRTLVITLTKRMAEDLALFLKDPAKTNMDLKVAYLHADIETLKRSDILADLRSGNYDVLVGINLLREGLDLPEVGMVVILDADKTGFLRSKTSLIQIMGRAARHVEGKVVLYADEVSEAMKGAILEVERRRRIQIAYNKRHGIIPRTIKKSIRPRIIEKEKEEDEVIDPMQLTPLEKKKLIKKLEKEMKAAARELKFERAAELRDKIKEFEVM